MKVFISADIEGVAGINHWDETEATKSDYEPFRKQMSEEVSAAVEGARIAGASEVIVRDAHDTARNILPRDLPRGVRLIRGWSGHPAMMMEGLDESFDVAFLIGYHSPGASSANPLAHTMRAANLMETKLNGVRASEFLLNTLYAASLRVPVVLVSGDEGLIEEATHLIDGLTTVASNKGVGNATYARQPLDVIDDIRLAAKRALEHPAGVLTLPKKFLLEVRFSNHTLAYRASFYPGASLVDETLWQFECNHIFDVHRALGFIL